MGLDKLWRSTGDRKYYDYMMNWANEVVRPDGSLVYFKGRSMDDMMAGSVVVWAYQQTKEEKFRKAADIIRKSYDDYPTECFGTDGGPLGRYGWMVFLWDRCSLQNTDTTLVIRIIASMKLPVS